MPTTKRRRTSTSYRNAPLYRDRLTGGANDVNPQLLIQTITAPSAGTAETMTVAVPTNPTQTGRSGAQVMEILKIWMHYASDCFVNAAVTWRGHICTQYSATVAYGSVNCIYYFNREHNYAAAGGTFIPDEKSLVDYTDNAGHGLIVASKNLYFLAQTTNDTSARAMSFHILYRFKNVGLSEYIGVVQTQTTNQ